MAKMLNDTADIEGISFANDQCMDDTQENIRILSVGEVGDSESKVLEIGKCSMYASKSSDEKNSFSSVAMLEGRREKVPNFHHKRSKHSTLAYTIRKKQSFHKSSLSVISKRKKIDSNYKSASDDHNLILSNINKNNGWTVFPARSKCNFDEEKQSILSTENIELCTSDDQQSDDETLTELPKKIFTLISESIVKCTLCFKQMKLSSMRQHYRTHTGVKPFKCQFCSNRFTRNADLHRHISSLHPRKGPLNIQCLVCTKYFIDKKSLICHLKSHNSALYLICHICGHKFKHKAYYQNHLKFVHSVATDASDSEVYKHALKQIKELQELDDKQNVEATGYQQKNEKSGESFNYSSDEDRDNLNIQVKEESYDIYGSELEGDECSPANASGVFVSEFSSQSAPSCNGLLTPTKKNSLNLDPKEMNSEVSEEEQLITKAIAEHVFQAENTLENIQLSLNQVEDPLILKENELTKDTEFNGNISAEDKLISEPKLSEIHVSASIDNKIQKFILRVPSGRLIDATTQKGMEVLVNLVRDLYSGKGELDGNIDITLHHNIS